MSQANGHSYVPVPGKIPGTPINLGGEEYIFAPLNLNAARRFEHVIPKLGQGDVKEQLETALPLFHASLQRNYPDITQDEVAELIDFGNLHKAIVALVSISGYKEKEAGEQKPASP